MDGEYNNNNMEMHQPEVPLPASSSPRRSVIGLVLGVIVVIAIVIWIGSWSLSQKPNPNEHQSLSDVEKQQILDSLQSDSAPLTPIQKADILKSLETAPKTSPLTEAEKQEILKSLR